MRRFTISGLPIVAIVLCCALVSPILFSCSTPPPPAPPSPTKEAARAQEIVRGTSTPDFPATPPPQPSTPSQGQPTPQQQAQGIVTQSGGFTSGTSSGGPIQPSPSQPVSVDQPQQPVRPASVDQPLPAQSYAITADERAFLTAYLSRLSYMVFYNDQGGMDPRLAKLAVSQANRYLIEQLGLSVLDFDQVSRNKKDQLDAFQTETGGSIDLIQYIAQKFNSDVYLEIDIKAGAEGYSGSYTATAQGTMKIYETSTGSVLGSVVFMSPPTFNPASADSAIANAVAASVWQAMPRVTEQSKSLLGAAFSRGVRYELSVQKTADSRQMSTFERAMARKFREVERLSYAPGETRFAIFTFQNRGAVEAAVYDAAKDAALTSLYLVFSRGKSFTFNTGL